jgi:calpain family cysteine protease
MSSRSRRREDVAPADSTPAPAPDLAPESPLPDASLSPLALQRVQATAGNQAALRLLARQEGGTATTAPPAEAQKLQADPTTLSGERITITDELLGIMSGSQGEPGMLGKHEDAGKYKEVKGTPFVGGPSPDDVNQGAIGDCYLLAALAAVAKANPKLIESMITDKGDGTYDVTLYADKGWFSKDLQPVVVNVTGTFPMDSKGDPLYGHSGDPTELWVMIIEKAYAKLKGGYKKIVGGFGGPAMEAITGKPSIRYPLDDYDETALASIFETLLIEGYAITAAADWAFFESTKDAAKKDVGMHFNHEYTVVGFDKKAKTVDLRNPWGEEHVMALPLSKLKKYFRFFDANQTK